MVEEYDSNNLKNQFTFKVTFNNMIALFGVAFLAFFALSVISLRILPNSSIV